MVDNTHILFCMFLFCLHFILFVFTKQLTTHQLAEKDLHTDVAEYPEIRLFADVSYAPPTGFFRP